MNKLFTISRIGSICGLLAVAGFVGLAGRDLGAQSVLPPYAAMRGTYQGLGQIIIQSGNRRNTSSGQTRVNVSLGDKGRLLRVTTKGRFLSNRSEGRVSSMITATQGGVSTIKAKDQLRNGRASGRGTANLRRTTVRFTLGATYNGERGTIRGSIRVRRGTLRLTQIFRGAEGTEVTMLVIAPSGGGGS